MEDVSNGDELLWEMEKCCLCFNIIQTDAKLLKCLHSACESCVSDKVADTFATECIEGDTIECPICNEKEDITKLMENPFISEVRDQNERSKTPPVQLCTSCSDNEDEEDHVAVKWCIDCLETLCSGCVLAHQRVRVTKEHILKDLDDSEAVSALQPSRVTYCSLHKQEMVSFFCNNCDELTCKVCQSKDHQGHRYQLINEKAEALRESLRLNMSSLRQKRDDLAELQKLIDERNQQLESRKCELRSEVEHFVKELIEAFHTRCNTLINTIDHISNRKEAALNQWKDKIDSSNVKIENTIRFLDLALSTGSDTALLVTKRNILKQISCLKNAEIKESDIPNPVLMSFSKFGSEQVLKAVETAGSITVDNPAAEKHKHYKPRYQTKYRANNSYPTPRAHQPNVLVWQQSNSAPRMPQYRPQRNTFVPITHKNGY